MFDGIKTTIHNLSSSLATTFYWSVAQQTRILHRTSGVFSHYLVAARVFRPTLLPLFGCVIADRSRALYQIIERQHHHLAPASPITRSSKDILQPLQIKKSFTPEPIIPLENIQPPALAPSVSETIPQPVQLQELPSKQEVIQNAILSKLLSGPHHTVTRARLHRQ